MLGEIPFETKVKAANLADEVAPLAMHQLFVLVLIGATTKCGPTLDALKRTLTAMLGTFVLKKQILVPEVRVTLVALVETLFQMNGAHVFVEVRALCEGGAAVGARRLTFGRDGTFGR